MNKFFNPIRVPFKPGLVTLKVPAETFIHSVVANYDGPQPKPAQLTFYTIYPGQNIPEQELVERKFHIIAEHEAVLCEEYDNVDLINLGPTVYLVIEEL